MTTPYDPVREALLQALMKEVGVYGLQCATTGELAPRRSLVEAIDRLATPAVSRAGGLEPSKLRRDQIVDLISSVSNNSADHDIAFAYRVLDAASAVAPTAPAEPSAGEAQS